MTAHSSIIGAVDDVFQRNYNRSSFSFAHRLTGNPLFELHHLVEYSGRLPKNPDLAYWSNGKVSVDDRWEANAGPRYSLQETIANIADNNSLVMLKRLELDPTFGPLLHEIMATVTGLSGPAMRDDVIIGRGTLLIASPRRITSYHIDSDTNFLFQITGNKLISVFDQTDRSLISDVELERYYTGDMNGAKFKESRKHEGTTYDLKASLGIHIPCMAPHWAQNADNVSIALSINFDLFSIDRLAHVYKLNSRLRRLGLDPKPPGQSKLRDRVKYASAKGLEVSRRLFPRPR
jgi:hypothetical protein